MVAQFMDMIANASAMIDIYFCEYYGDRVFFVVTVICFAYLFVFCKELRFKFLLPIVVILLVIVNPIAYYYVFSKILFDFFSSYLFSRFFDAHFFLDS